MNSKNIIQGLIIVLAVSLLCASIYAQPSTDSAHNDTIDNGSSDNVDGLYVSGSGDVCHVSGLNGNDHVQYNIYHTQGVII